MNRRHLHVASRCVLAALALTFVASAYAGDKNKSDRIKFAPSGNGGSGNGSSMKLHSKSLSKQSTGNNSFNSNNFSKSLSSSSKKSFGQLNQDKLKLQDINSNSDKYKFNGETLLSEKDPKRPYHRGPNTKFPFATEKSIAEAIAAGGPKPIDPGIGNGTGGTIPWPGKFTSGDNGIRIGEPNGPGKGNGKGPGKGKGKGKHKDCHDDYFPWWPILIGGGYTGGHCHQHHNCYDNYNGGYYSNVTNIVIQEPTAPVEPALANGVDLELLDVRLVDAGDAARNLGPRYRLTFGNRGTLPAGNFQVMLMASSDGTPQPGLPFATSEIDTLASRQVVTADVRLPLTAELSTLTRYIVVIDSAAQIGEPDENNNLAVLDRDKIIVVVQ